MTRRSIQSGVKGWRSLKQGWSITAAVAVAAEAIWIYCNFLHLLLGHHSPSTSSSSSSPSALITTEQKQQHRSIDRFAKQSKMKKKKKKKQQHPINIPLNNLSTSRWTPPSPLLCLAMANTVLVCVLVVASNIIIIIIKLKFRNLLGCTQHGGRIITCTGTAAAAERTDTRPESAIISGEELICLGRIKRASALRLLLLMLMDFPCSDNR